MSVYVYIYIIYNSSKHQPNNVRLYIIYMYIFKFLLYFEKQIKIKLRWYLTLQGDNSVKSAERFNYVALFREY